METFLLLGVTEALGDKRIICCLCKYNLPRQNEMEILCFKGMTFFPTCAGKCLTDYQRAGISNCHNKQIQSMS